MGGVSEWLRHWKQDWDVGVSTYALGGKPPSRSSQSFKVCCFHVVFVWVSSKLMGWKWRGTRLAFCALFPQQCGVKKQQQHNNSKCSSSLETKTTTKYSVNANSCNDYSQETYSFSVLNLRINQSDFWASSVDWKKIRKRRGERERENTLITRQSKL